MVRAESKPVAARKARRSPKDAADGLSDGALGRAPLDQRAPSSDIERPVQHASTSVETGVHGPRDEPGAAGFLEPRAPGARNR